MKILTGITGDKFETPNKRALKINMALRGDNAKQVVELLIGHPVDPTVFEQMHAELQTMPEVKPTELDETAVNVFAYYTKEGYENVTGLARGNQRWDKLLGKDREMSDAEKKKGEKTLSDLLTHWPKMTKFPGTTVYRVVKKKTELDALEVGKSMSKPNPTSTSIALDWSRVDPEKTTSCKITITNGSKTNGPVDIRAVSTYTHEGEILLPPRTNFKMIGVEGDYKLFEAILP
jgi:hypothetical protein